MMNELRYALRTLVRTPGSSGITVVILACGVTAVISAFSVLRAVAIDPTFFGVGLFVLAVSTLASWVPASRTTRIDPMEALRHE